ncbi:MAG: acylneuraminate cytidylyltransferase family protein [Thermodesulfobacteriota bacterium]|nr:acylneuraminate cytidylyltransferase family protein [Thermodesulfobacteriota bacterium]
MPARGGSRGLPGKNVKNLCGKPLIAYTLEAALGAALVTRVVVSTDDRNIASVAREHGAEVPFMRPSELADDRALVVQAVEYTLNRLKREEGYSPDFIAVLYPTSPFRPAGLVNHLVAIGLEKESPVITVRRIVQDGFSLFVKDKSNKIVPMKIKGHASETGRRSYYRSYGIFNGIMPGSSSSPYLHVLDEEFYFVDIDTEEDFLFAESIINNNLFKFSKQ